MIDLIAQSVRLTIDMLTPLLVGMSAVFFVLWLASLCRGTVPLAKGIARFRDLTPLRKLALFVLVGLFTLWGGSKDGVLSPPAQPNGIPPALPRIIEPVQLRTLPEEVATNALAITGFAIDLTNRTAHFETRWASNLFDHTDSSDFCLFSSTNLLERRWVPLGVFAMPTGTNSCAFTVATNNLDAAVVPWFLDTLNGAGFYRLGIDFDSDGDGLTDACERYWTLTDPESADTDGDGLSDSQELSPGVDTDPLAYDTDGDGVGDWDELAAGANPRSGDTDGDGLPDAAEIGAASALTGDGFAWFDMSGGTDLLSGYSTADDEMWTIPLPAGAVVNNTCHTNAAVCMNGAVHLLCPTNTDGYCDRYYTRPRDMGNTMWSDGHITVALCNADLYARPAEWGSRILYGSFESGGRVFGAVEYRNIGLRATRNTNELITCQLIIPSDETNTVYVSYLCASNAFRSAGLVAGVQCGGIPSRKQGERYYSLPCPAGAGFPEDGVTVRYQIGAGTDPANADTDGDGLSDSDEALAHLTDPLAADTDGDGLTDSAEVSAGTDPRSADTDGDGMPDGWEVGHALNPALDDSALDADGDGLSNLAEYASGTDPRSADTDGDGLSDREELGWWEYAQPLPALTYSSATNLLSPASTYDDEKFLAPLPFVARFAGHRAAGALVSVNGFAWLVTETGALPTASDYRNYDLVADLRSPHHGFIAAYWDDLQAYAGRDAQITVSDAYAGGRRYCVIRYENVSVRLEGNIPSNTGSFRIAIPEGETNTVYVSYDSLGPAFDGSGATIGAQSPNRFRNFPVSCNESGSVSNGMVIAYHFGTGSDPLVPDTDGDGLGDGEEVSLGTNPSAPDTDCDGLADAWEVGNGLDPLSASGGDGADGDPDGDGLTNLQEQSLGGNPQNADTDGDGLPDAREVQLGTSLSSADTDCDGLPDGLEDTLGTNPLQPDSDGDGMNDGWEYEHRNSVFDPSADNAADANPDNDLDSDPDGDGLTNGQECEWGTNPAIADTDGDGLGDGAEVAQNSDPTDRADTIPVKWVTVTGDLPVDQIKETRETVTVPARTAAYVGVFIHSEEYPDWTGQQSEYNDMVYWKIQTNDETLLTGDLHVNTEEVSFEYADMDGWSVGGFSPVEHKEGSVLLAGDTDLVVSVTLRAINVRDGLLPSSVIVGIFPLKVVQSNMPAATGVANTTDAGTSYVRESIRSQGVAYITGQPAAPQLTAQFKDLPDWIDVAWGGTLVTERGERHALDNRTLLDVTCVGSAAYSITAGLQNEIVGGACSLFVQVSGAAPLTYPLAIRGKNPLDATAREYITANVDAEFQPYAWMIAKHESKSGSRVYNQFNPSNPLIELPNKTNGANRWGWGISQIDKGEDGDSTAEVYDWHENVASMNATLRDKKRDYNRFIGYYREAYANNPATQWIEPDNVTTNIDGYEVSAAMWGILTLYNGAQGILPQTAGRHRGFQCPLEFCPLTTNWVFHANVRDYVSLVLGERTESEVE